MKVRETMDAKVNSLFSQAMKQGIVDAAKKEYGISKVDDEVMTFIFNTAFIYGYCSGQTESWNEFTANMQYLIRRQHED